MNIAFFDFDGTITSRDSMIDFIIYAVGYKKFFTCMLQLLPDLFKYKVGLVQNWRAKEMAITRFFGGWDSSRFDKIASEYSERRIPLIVRDVAKKAIASHKENGDVVVVVSASCEKWLKTWCDLNSIELIGTVFEIDNGMITGKISGKNCYGAEKVERINKKYNLSNFQHIYAYGDSSGDMKMLGLADIKYYRWRRI